MKDERPMGNGKGMYIPEVTVEMFRTAPLEAVEELLADGVMYNLDLKEEIHREREQAYMQGYEDGKSRIKGEWLKWNDVLECSECGYGLMTPTVFRGAECVAIRTPCYFKYCPICGSEMENYEEFWIPNNK